LLVVYQFPFILLSDRNFNYVLVGNIKFLHQLWCWTGRFLAQFDYVLSSCRLGFKRNFLASVSACDGDSSVEGFDRRPTVRSHLFSQMQLAVSVAARAFGPSSISVLTSLNCVRLSHLFVQLGAVIHFECISAVHLLVILITFQYVL